MARYSDISGVKQMAVISIIVAMSENKVIGKDNKLPWHIPEDLEWFKKHTNGKPVIMGRKTHESIGKKLPRRKNIVITRDKGYKPLHKDVLVCNSLDEAIKTVSGSEEIMIIGGAEIYEQALPLSNRIYKTLILSHINGDTYFPKVNPDDWKIISSEGFDNEQCTFIFTILERVI